MEEDESILHKKVSSYIRSTKRPATGLFLNEADASLAARSHHAVVLTNDKKNGPLREAKNNLGGIVISLDDWKNNRGIISLSSFIKAEITRLNTQKS